MDIPETAETRTVLKFPLSITFRNPYDLPRLRMSQHTRSLPVEILLLIRKYCNIFDTLPEDVAIRIFHQLDYSGRSCLALTSKDNARIAVKHGLLVSTKSPDQLTDEMDEFFRLYGFDLPDLKFCTQCGLYRSYREDFWRNHALTELGKIGGRLAIRWRQAIARWNSIDLMIRCWLTADPVLIRRAGTNSRVCPECILDQHSEGELPGTT